MKKVLITESQLRAMVRKELLNEMNGTMPLMNTSTENNINRILDRSTQLKTAIQKDPSVVGNEVDGIILKILQLMNIETKNLPNVKAGLMTAYNKLVKEKIAANAPQSFANTPQLEESRIRRKKRF